MRWPGVSGAFTRTTPVPAGDRPCYVMTIQRDNPPEVRADGDKVVVGGVTFWFDGKKMVVKM